MRTVQLAIRDSDYAQVLRSLLLRDGVHRVFIVDEPDTRTEGVIVIDESKFHRFVLTGSEPDRFVVITRKGSSQLSRVWDAGIRHVVFEEDSPSTAQLAIIAAELRQPRAPGSARPGEPDGTAGERQDQAGADGLSVINTMPRCRKSGPKSAHS